MLYLFIYNRKLNLLPHMGDPGLNPEEILQTKLNWLAQKQHHNCKHKLRLEVEITLSQTSVLWGKLGRFHLWIGVGNWKQIYFD